jgi:endonuclease III
VSAVGPAGERTRRRRAAEVWERLAATYPDARCSLDYRNPFELLVATILSAQCTDARVNEVAPRLFARCPTPAELAAIPTEELEAIIQPTGFFRNKARALQGTARLLLDEFGGEVPRDMDSLVRLPGVARKTANVVLGNAFSSPVGIAVDTHVGRLSRRLGLTVEEDPVKVEADLMRLFPRERWTMLTHLLIYHGRAVCTAQRPRCGECVLADLCPSAGIGELAPRRGRRSAAEVAP